MVLADTGEEEIAWCNCGYGANSEKGECLEDIYEKSNEQVLDMQEISTPNVGTIEDVSKFLNSSAQKFIKTIIYVADGTPVAVLVRGDYEINEIKLQSVLGCSELELATPEIIMEVTGAQAVRY